MVRLRKERTGPSGKTWPQSRLFGPGKGHCSRIDEVEGCPNQHHHEQAEYAAFRSDGASREPGGTLKRGIQQMPGGNHPAVRNRIEESFAPIPGGVKSDREPEASSATECQTEKQADERC